VLGRLGGRGAQQGVATVVTTAPSPWNMPCSSIWTGTTRRTRRAPKLLLKGRVNLHTRAEQLRAVQPWNAGPIMHRERRRHSIAGAQIPDGLTRRKPRYSRPGPEHSPPRRVQCRLGNPP